MSSNREAGRELIFPSTVLPYIMALFLHNAIGQLMTVRGPPETSKENYPDMIRHHDCWLIATTTVLAVTFWSGNAHGIAKFAKLYRKNCEACHSAVPQLNEYGAAFMLNGFVLPEQKEAGKGDNKPPSESAGGKSVEKLPGTLTAGSPDSKVMDTPKTDPEQNSENSEGTASQPAREPPTPTVVYRLPSSDGSLSFTDNPIRLDNLEAIPPEQKNRPHVPAPRKRPGKNLQKEAAITVQQQPVPSVSMGKNPVRFRSYGECMERQLEEAPSPGSVDKMMELFVAAEKLCTSFQKGTR
jgi:membrane peptidoglycan carboxypeptidase